MDRILGPKPYKKGKRERNFLLGSDFKGPLKGISREKYEKAGCGL
jgi:hypothetical protein